MDVSVLTMCSCRKSPSPGALSIRTRIPSFTVVLKPTARRSVLVLGLSLAGQVYRMRPPLFPNIYVAPATRYKAKEKCISYLFAKSGGSTLTSERKKLSKHMLSLVTGVKSRHSAGQA